MFTRIVASARRSVRSLQTVRCIPSGDSDQDDGPGKGLGSVVPPKESKSRTPRKPAKEEKGKGLEKNRNAGNPSMLPDMPFDVLYDVSCRTISSAGGI